MGEGQNVVGDVGVAQPLQVLDNRFPGEPPGVFFVLGRFANADEAIGGRVFTVAG